MRRLENNRAKKQCRYEENWENNAKKQYRYQQNLKIN